MSETTTEFPVLVARARQGDESALAEFARRYEPEVRIVARVLIGPALRPYLDSMDLVQSVHRSLLIGLRAGKFEVATPDRLLALALTMVRRKVARHWRREQRRRHFRRDASGADPLLRMLSSLCSRDLDPARAVQLDETLARVCAGLDSTARRVLELRLQGLSTAEVARQLGLDADVLRVRLSRLRQELRAAGMLEECL